MSNNNKSEFKTKELLSVLSERGNLHLNEVEIDLSQTEALLLQAVEKLSESFHQIHAGVSAQDKIISLWGNGVDPTAEECAKIKELQKSVHDGVGAAITGLQFQDMTSQLIKRGIKHVIGLRALLVDIKTAIEKVPESSRPEEFAAIVASLTKMMNEQSEELSVSLSKAVSQTSMDSGDIEFF